MNQEYWVEITNYMDSGPFPTREKAEEFITTVDAFRCRIYKRITYLPDALGYVAYIDGGPQGRFWSMSEKQLDNLARSCVAHTEQAINLLFAMRTLSGEDQ